MEDQVNLEIENKGRKRKLLIFALLLFIISGLILIYIYFGNNLLTNLIRSQTMIDTVEDDQDQNSPFSYIINDQYQDSDSIRPDYTVRLDDVDEVFYNESKQVLSTPLDNMNEDWYWENSWLYGRISYFDEENIIIDVKIPDKFENVNATYDFDIDKTLVLSKMNYKLIGTHINFYEYANTGFPIFTRCFDETCSRLGPECIIVDTNQ